ncbi:MAG TPA: hypothetical protein VGO00_26520, partial [Kofleriaceae bacterium]|nr:hypothetical protein [Kofleriaceae bacterium]
MDEPRAMNGREPGTDLLEHRDDLAPRASLDLEPRGERHTVDELHRDEQPTVVVSDLVDPRDVRVLEASHRLGLAEQSRAIRRAIDLAANELDRDRAAENRVVAREHHAHAAFAEPLAHDEVTDHLAGRVVEAADETAGRRGVGIGVAVVGRLGGRDRDRVGA